MELLKIILVVLCAHSIKAQLLPLLVPQLYVPRPHDCSCNGFILKATECKWENWELQQCDTESEDYINYKWHCDRINTFRFDRTIGAILAEFNQTVNCKCNLSEEQLLSYNGVDMSLQPPMARSLTNNPKYPSTLAVPTKAIDWRSTLTPIKDQGNCGSCWAFAANGLCEWHYSYIMKKTNILSEQCLMDCDSGDYGCDGGWPATVLEYLTTTGTVASSYYTPPYSASQAATCSVPSSQARIKCPAASEELFTSTTAGNCNRLKALLTKGPVYVGYYADSSFSRYKSGVYTPPYSTTCPAVSINHAVMIVGWIPNYKAPSSLLTKPVWILRNSWGTSWGQSGYAYIDASKNVCSICNFLWYYKV